MDIDDIAFIDSETRRIPDTKVLDVTHVGAYRYAPVAFATVWGWGVGETGDITTASLDDGFHERLSWEVDAPDALKRHYERAEKGEAWFAAWNMAFDRQIWNSPQSDFPHLRADMTIDVMAQAAAAGLPAKLKDAAKFVGLTQKLDTGSHLIKIFEPPNGETPHTRPKDWVEFVEYGGTDVEAMRDIYRSTRSLSMEDWETYWANEEINDRGIGLDVDLCNDVAELVDASRGLMDDKVKELTQGTVTAVTQVKKILGFVSPILARDSRAYNYLIDKKLVLFENGEVKRPEKLSLSRDRIENVVAYLGTRELDDLAQAAYDVLVLRQYGGSNTPMKFRKAADASVDSRLQGQYVFNGARQTTRFSSRGVQVHNLARASHGDKEVLIIEAIKSLVDHNGR